MGRIIWVVGWKGLIDASLSGIDPVYNSELGKSSSSFLVQWSLGNSFPNYRSAQSAVRLAAQRGVALIIVEQDKKPDFTPEAYRLITSGGSQKMHVETALAKPLNVRRNDLISRLRENLDAAEAERAAAVAKEKDARLTFQQLVTDNEDKVIGFFREYFSRATWVELTTVFEEAFEGDRYLPKASTPTRKENDLEKFIRVLNITADDTVEVLPDTDLYALL